VRTLAGLALGTTWRVRLAAGGTERTDALEARIAARLAQIVAQMSQWQADSLLSRFNRSAPGTWMTLPPDFATVVAAALAMAGLTGGAFDPTLGRASALLGFGAAPWVGPPSAAALDAAHAAAGWRRLAYDAEARRLRQPGGLWLDLSGIAKGFAVDAVADLLSDHGIEDALVEIGGELAGRGLRPDGQPWWVDAELPDGVEAPPLRIGLHDQAVATSGDYVRGAHTLDPRDGRPLASCPASVTVIHRSALWADAWATALTVLGQADGRDLAEDQNIAVRFLGRSGDTAEIMSTAMSSLTG
jgi:thiamine biosynthesis lipoprotein